MPKAFEVCHSVVHGARVSRRCGFRELSYGSRRPVVGVGLPRPSLSLAGSLRLGIHQEAEPATAGRAAAP